MGSWGPGIFSDDLACDLREEFRELIAEGHSPEEATTKLRDAYTPDDDLGDRTTFYLALAAVQWKAGRLLEPVGDNAFESYSKVLDLDPEHTEVQQNLVQIGRISAAIKLFLSAESLLRQGELDAARRMIETGLKINPNDERLLGLARALDYDQ